MQLDITSQTTITVTMDEEYAVKLNRAIGRVLEAVDSLPPDKKNQIINTGAVDALLALKTGIYTELT